jgi:excisionase family DNA binding protein
MKTDSDLLEGFEPVKRVAEKLDVTPRTVQRMCADGVLPYVKFRGKHWVHIEEARRRLLAQLADQTKEAA